MAGLKYGPQWETGPRPRRLPIEASQQFHERGNAFLTATAGTGHLGLTLTADTTVDGWLLTGFSPGLAEVSGSYGSRKFTTSATAGTEYLCKPLDGSEMFFVITDRAFAEADRGDAADILGVNDGTQQTVDLGTNTTDLFRVIDGVVGASECFVMVNPAKLTALT